ncbi:MAG: PGN_0703 family putative restriction endonuclease [Candidatus Limnocylindrales bacterium]
MSETPSRQQLEAADCWEPNDVIPRRPAMTAFRQRTRYEQARWRLARGYPIGSQPHVPRPGAPKPRPVGSRLPLDYAQETGANLVTPAALGGARARMSVIEPRQSFDHQRLWADLLSSEALAFNLFGDLAAAPPLADRAVHAWWPDAPGRISDVRFAHSPGRLDPAWLNSLREFDAAFELGRADQGRGIVAVDVKFHERLKAETPKPENLWRTVAVAERSGAFGPGAIDALSGRSELAVIWLEHLLLLSMLQHVSGKWTWGRYVVVHPAGNPDMVEACARYRSLLANESTFGTMTIEELLDSAVLPAATTGALRERYLADRS